MEIDNQFQEAVQLSKRLAYPPSNERLLQMYSLYKQATEGDNQNERPGEFDLVGRAKHDAWSAMAGTPQDEAKQKYIDLINYLASKKKQSVVGT